MRVHVMRIGVSGARGAKDTGFNIQKHLGFRVQDFEGMWGAGFRV